MNTADKKVIRLLNMDFPDPDVIRVDDTYYMISTTMHFNPGGQILKSKDLISWEHAAYVYEYPEDTSQRRMEGNAHIYGKGMWAATLRFHKDTFYVCFVANDTHKTYLYRAKQIEGPWEMNEIQGFYHDCSLLFEEEATYIVYGNKQIYLTQLNEELTGPKEGGLHRLLLEDNGDVRLGYEGAHFYKINGRYYLFFIHWPNTGAGRRTQACFVADSLEGEFTGRDIFDWDGGFRNAGVAQGGIVDTPEGDWYAILFQDCGAVGRIPVLVPMEWEDGFPLLCQETADYGAVPDQVKEAFCFSDDFSRKDGKLDPRWQWNHIPDNDLWRLEGTSGMLQTAEEGSDVVQRAEKVFGGLRITTDGTAPVMTLAKNVLTQRTCYPACAAEVTVDGFDLKDGDYAGLGVLQGAFAMIGLHRREGRYYLAMRRRKDCGLVWGNPDEAAPDELVQEILWEADPQVKLRLEASFEGEDICKCFYEKDGEWKQLGVPHALEFRLDHFTGARFGLFVYATKQPGGSAVFSDFCYSL